MFMTKFTSKKTNLLASIVYVNVAIDHRFIDRSTDSSTDTYNQYIDVTIDFVVQRFTVKKINKIKAILDFNVNIDRTIESSDHFEKISIEQ